MQLNHPSSRAGEGITIDEKREGHRDMPRGISVYCDKLRKLSFEQDFLIQLLIRCLCWLPRGKDIGMSVGEISRSKARDVLGCQATMAQGPKQVIMSTTRSLNDSAKTQRAAIIS